MTTMTEEEERTPNSTYPKGGVSCFADSFVQAESSVLRMKFSGKNPALRVAAKRQAVKKPLFSLKTLYFSITRVQIKPFEKANFLGCKFNWVENKV